MEGEKQEEQGMPREKQLRTYVRTCRIFSEWHLRIKGMPLARSALTNLHYSLLTSCPYRCSLRRQDPDPGTVGTVGTVATVGTVDTVGTVRRHGRRENDDEERGGFHRSIDAF